MSREIKRLTVTILVLSILLVCVSCKAPSKVNEKAKTAPITSEWTYDHAINKGEYVPRYLFEKEENLPQFSTDGKTYTFSIVSGNVYSGTVENNGDGTYKIYRENAEKSVLVTITGNALTVHIDDESSVVFVAKK